MICNSGHFNVELAFDQLAEPSKALNTSAREFVDEYVQPDDRRLNVLGEGRLISLAAAHGHPPSVMNMSFAARALATEWSLSQRIKLGHKVNEEIDPWVANLKLQTMGVTIDALTDEQVEYLSSWEMGT